MTGTVGHVSSGFGVSRIVCTPERGRANKRATGYLPTMTVSVCPAAVIAAPVERVWSLLMDPRKIGAWSYARLEEAAPDGSTQVGQRRRFSSTAVGKRWPVVMNVAGLDPEHHILDLEISLPLGIDNREHISVTSVADGTTHVQYG